MTNNERQGGPSSSVQSVFETNKIEVLTKAIQRFPYLIRVFAPDGTAVFVNEAVRKQYGLTKELLEQTIIGKYNVLKDPAITAAIPLSLLQRAFGGETVYCPNIKLPLKALAGRYGAQDYDMEAMYQDITIFPVSGDAGQVAYVMAVQIVRRVYRGKKEIERVKEYIETHWLDKYNAEAAAQIAGLSKAHLTRFRQYTGKTLHEYYTDYRIERLKERLQDSNLSIGQAYAVCNMNYNGYYAKIFKNKVGLSPSGYRKQFRGN